MVFVLCARRNADRGPHLPMADDGQQHLYRRDPDDFLIPFDDGRATGEIAGYYHLPGGTVIKGALIRYLGRDSGMRFDLRQPLGGGWQLETYLALSDADELLFTGVGDFAETGGADFGVRLTAPFEALWSDRIGQVLRVTPVVNVQALGRDQAQSLNLPVRLYDWIAPGHLGTLVQGWPGLGWH